MKEALEVVYGTNSTITLRTTGFNPDHVVTYDYADPLTDEQMTQIGVRTREVICVDFVNGQSKYLLGTPGQLFLKAPAKKTLLKS